MHTVLPRVVVHNTTGVTEKVTIQDQEIAFKETSVIMQSVVPLTEAHVNYVSEHGYDKLVCSKHDGELTSGLMNHANNARLWKDLWNVKLWTLQQSEVSRKPCNISLLWLTKQYGGNLCLQLICTMKFASLCINISV